MTDATSGSGPAAWERLSALYESAISLPKHERDSLLDAVSKDDAPLHAELVALLAAADDAPAYLRALASEVIAPAFDAAVAAHADHATLATPSTPERSLAGTRIRHYEVQALLGAGGMGVVHRGRDTRLGRDVALKFLSSASFSDPSARARLVREAQAVSALDDPHVCAVHAIEETDDGGLCLIMSYCAGGTLRDLLRAGPISVEDAVTIAIQLASGLASAHRRHIIHRDLKPANVGFADGNVAKILDFGVAVRLGAEDTVSVSTRTGFAGTLPYTAPELLRGGAPDVRSDLWSLGVVLYEMLAGKRPFTGAIEGALVHAILNHEPAPPARVSGTAIPNDLATLVRELLSKAPARRPASADDVLVRLRALDDSVPSHSVARGAPTSTAWWRQRSIGIGAGAALLTSMAIAIAFTQRATTGTASSSDAAAVTAAAPLPTLAVLPFAVRGDATLDYLRDGMVDLLTPAFDATGLVRGIDPNSVIGASTQVQGAILDSAAARSLAERVGAARYVVGSVVRAGDVITLRATLYRANGLEAARAQEVVTDPGKISGGIESLVRQLATAELRAPGDTVAALAASTTTSNRALRAYLDGERELRDARPAAAVAHFLDAVAADSMFALAWYRLARAARWSDVDSLNTVATSRAYALSSTLPLRVQQVVRGYHAMRFGRPNDAERQFRQIVADYPTDVDAWMLLGETLFDNNPFAGRSSAESGEAFQRVMQLDPRNREVTTYLMELAARADMRGKLDTLFSMYFSPNSAGEQPGIRDTYLALHARRVRRVERRITDPVSAQIALRRAGSDALDLAAARQFANMLIASTNPPAMRTEGLLALASLDVAAQQGASAQQRWRDATSQDPAVTLLHQAMVMAAPAVSWSADSLRAVRQRLTTAAIPTNNGGFSIAEQRTLRLYLSGLLSARLGDTTALDNAAQQLTRVRSADRLAAPLGQALRGHAAKSRGDYATALSAFENSDVALPIGLRSQLLPLWQFADRLARAETLRALGRESEATRWYASLRDGPAVWGAPYRVTR